MEQLWLFCLKIGQEIFGWFSNLNIFRKGAEQPYTEPNWSENQLTCNQIQKLSPPSGIQTFAIKLTYYQLSSDHIHLLDGLNCYQTHLLSILSCNQQFCYTIFDAFNPNICQFYFYISAKKWNNFSFGILHFLCKCMELASLDASSNSVPNADFKKSIFDKKYQFLTKNINFWNKNQFGFCFCFVSPRIPLSSLKLWAHAVQPAIRNIYTKEDVLLNRDNNSRLA